MVPSSGDGSGRLAQQQLPAVLANPITEHELVQMFAGFVQSQSFFQDYRLQLLPQFFSAKERPWELLWIAVDRLISAYNQCNPHLLHAFLQSMHGQARAAEDRHAIGVLLGNQQQGGLLGMLHQYQLAPGMLDHARTLVSRFITERGVARFLRRHMDSGNPHEYPENIGELLQVAQQRMTLVSGSGRLPSASVAPAFGSIAEAPLVQHRLGVPFVDAYTGGHEAGGVYGVLAAIGRGKTTLCGQLAVATALQSAREALQTGTTPGLAVMITCEEASKLVLPRVWSCAYKIDRNKCAALDWSRFTTAANMEAYERAFVIDGQPLAETDRWNMNRGWLDRGFMLMDFSGSPEFPGAGTGYVSELVATLMRIQEERRQPIRAVFVDYAGIYLRRHMGAKNLEIARHYRQMLADMGNRIKTEIALRFNTCVWLFHQLRPDCAKASPFAELSFADAEGSHQFAENFSVCGVIGNPDLRTGVQRLIWSKTRYAVNSGENRPRSPLVRLHRHFAQFDCVTDEYELHENEREVWRRGDRRQADRAAVAAVQPGHQPSTHMDTM